MPCQDKLLGCAPMEITISQAHFTIQYRESVWRYLSRMVYVCFVIKVMSTSRLVKGLRLPVRALMRTREWRPPLSRRCLGHLSRHLLAGLYTLQPLLLQGHLAAAHTAFPLLLPHELQHPQPWREGRAASTTTSPGSRMRTGKTKMEGDPHIRTTIHALFM